MGPLLILWLATVALVSIGWGFLPRLRTGDSRRTAAPADPARVSVIIPARNEEHNLPALLRSLASQSVRPGEILVVDDGSTDRTAEVAVGMGARVIRSEPLPAGWRGKSWACDQGARAATGEWLLFLDADTWLEPGGLERLAAGYPGGAFSAGPFHAVRRPYEQLSLFFNLDMTLGTVPEGLFGPMLLVDRESYLRVGGHAAVRDRILENFFLAARFREAGIRTGSAVGRGLVSFRMYPNGVRELISGWAKAFASGAGGTPRGTLARLVAWKFGLMTVPLAWAATGEWLLWGLAYLYGAGSIGCLARRVGAFRWWSVLLYPVPLVFFFLVFGWSARRAGKSVTWKGREVRAH